MAQVPQDLGQRIVHAARLAAALHIRAVINEEIVFRRLQTLEGRTLQTSSNPLRIPQPPTKPTPPTKGAA